MKQYYDVTIPKRLHSYDVTLDYGMHEADVTLPQRLHEMAITVLSLPQRYYFTYNEYLLLQSAINELAITKYASGENLMRLFGEIDRISATVYSAMSSKLLLSPTAEAYLVKNLGQMDSELSLHTVPFTLLNIKYVDANEGYIYLDTSEAELDLVKQLYPAEVKVALLSNADTVALIKYDEFEEEMTLETDKINLSYVDYNTPSEFDFALQIEASASITKLRLLGEMDDSTLGDFDNLTLSEVALITIDD